MFCNGNRMTSEDNQGLLASTVARNLKFGLGDGGFIQGGLISRGLGGRELPASDSGRS